MADAKTEELLPCPVCGNEERGQGGYLSCECPAPAPQPADVPHDVVRAEAAVADIGMAEIETVARSDAKYDGRDFDGLGRADKERYRSRAWAGLRALATAAPSTSTEEVVKLDDADDPITAAYVAGWQARHVVGSSRSTSTEAKCFECDGPLHGPYCPACRPTEEALRAENARLREALKDIAESGDNDNVLDPTRNKRAALSALSR